MISRPGGFHGLDLHLSLRLLLLLLLAASLAGAPRVNAAETTGAEDDTTGVAGDEDGEEGEASEEAPADTAAAAAQATRRSGRRFSPNYSSGFEINRNTSTWSQGLSFNSWVGPVDFNSSTSVAIGKDNTLDRNRRQRTTNIGLTYNVPNGLRIGSAIAVTRNQTVDAGRTRNSQESERFNINASYARTLVTDLSSTFTASAGTSRNHQDDPLTSSRESIGPHAEAAANFALKRGADWSLRTAIRNSYLRSTEDRTGQTTRDNNLGGDLGFKVDFQVPGFDNWSLTAGRKLNRTQYPLVVGTNARQETNTNHNRDLSLNASATPWPDLNLSGGVSYRNNNVDRAIDTERSQQSIDRGADWKLTYQFPDSTRVEMRQQWSLPRLFTKPIPAIS